MPNPLLPAAAALLALTLATPARAATSPFAGLYTSYTPSLTAVGWVTCGATGGSEGCFGSRTLTPFHHACAMLTGTATVSGSVQTTPVYVMDAGTAAAPTVVLDAYRKTDTLSGSFVTTAFTLIKQISLPLTGGTTASCQLAGNPAALFAGTSLSANAAEISTATGAASRIGGFSPPANVSQITANAAGYISVQFGTTGFYLFSPDGSGEADGGGQAILPDNRQGTPIN